jgi:ribosomal protein S27E
MSSHETIQVTCPNCRHEQAFEHWHSVNITLHPELRERVLSGELFTLACAKCGEETTVQKALLYNDMERGFMICLSPTEPPALPSSGMADMAKVRLRRVETPAHLSEKIRIFEDGLDDRLIEIQKILVADLLREELRDEPLALLYDGLEEHPKEGRQIGFLVFLKKSVRKVSFPFAEIYEDGVRLLDALRPKHTEEPGRWALVDAAGTKQWLASMENATGEQREETDE